MNGTALMREIGQQTQQLLDGVVTDGARDRVLERLVRWITTEATKRSDLDTVQRQTSFCKRLEGLASSVQLEYGAGGKLVVRATGDGAETLRMLRNGTTWFNPAPDADSMIVTAILVEPSI